MEQELISPLQYYSDKVLFEIIKQMRGREVSLLKDSPPVRCIKAHNLGYLKSNFRRWDFYQKHYNIYISLAKYENMPMFSFKPEDRRKQQKDFNYNVKDYYVGYDLGLDFDCKNDNFDDTYEECKLLKQELDDFKVKYKIKFSGSGFHINIDNIYLPASNGVEKFVSCGQFVKNLKTIFNFLTLDTELYDMRRCWKVAYSLDVKSGNIALPLDDEQFDNFSHNMVKPSSIIKLGIKNRGLLERDGLDNGFKNFCKEYNLW